MTTVYAIHAPEADHLSEVVEAMKMIGAPTIRAVNCSDFLMALEGSHRLAAASQLGLTPTFEVIEQDEIIDLMALDIDTYNLYGETYSAGELAAELIGMHNPVYIF